MAPAAAPARIRFIIVQSSTVRVATLRSALFSAYHLRAWGLLWCRSSEQNCRDSERVASGGSGAEELASRMARDRQLKQGGAMHVAMLFALVAFMTLGFLWATLPDPEREEYEGRPLH